MIDALREDEQNYTVSEICKAFGASRSGYYATGKASEGLRARQDREIIKKMNEIHAHRHTRCYGSPRMTAELVSLGISCSENRVARLMRENGLNATAKAAFRPKTTMADPFKSPAPNLLKNAPEPSSPGEVYVSDITYVATREGWLYLAVVIDLYTRLVAGWTLADHMEAGLATTAFASATACVPPAEGAIFHSDRGSQYTSKQMRSHLRLLRINQSMSAKGNCYDNAKSESFFASLKREAFPDGCCFETKKEAQQAIFDYLETFYNRRRRHSSLGNISPEDFLKSHFQNQKPTLN